MRRLLCVFIAVFGLIHDNEASAERRMINSVPYVHQVMDMDTSEFWGYNACGSTSAVMITQFYNLQPINPSIYPGYWVYNAYPTGVADQSGENYDSTSAKDWNPGIYPYHINDVYGAHGFIVEENPIDYWGTNSNDLMTYIENHGLLVSLANTTLFEKIQLCIRQGQPLIGHWSGHYFVIIGYDTGIGNNIEQIVVHDPFGDKNTIWNGSTSGQEKTYSFPVVANETIDRVYVIVPVGIYNSFPDFHDDGTSQAFVDAYNEAGGESVLGIPWDNGGTIFVHNFPDENSNEAILIQDLLFTDSLNNVFWNLLVYNNDLEEVFPLTGQILDFWWENSGYNTYGPPTEAAHSETDVNNNAIIVQGFQSGMCRP